MSRRRSGFLHALLVIAVLCFVVPLSRGEPAQGYGRIDTAASTPLAQRPWETVPPRRVYFASPSGHPGNVGSATQPLDLASALSAGGPVGPGDLLWLRGGTYFGNFRSELSGAADAFIVVAPFPGERAILDGAPASDRDVLRVDGSHTVYWGLEVTNSVPDQAGLIRGTGVNVFGPYTKIINMVVHHTGNGIGVWTPALEAEVYGNLIYEVGWDDEDRGHGHSIYIQNDKLTKRVVDNVLFDGRSYGVHAFTHGGQINNLYFEGNIAFDHGLRAKASGPKANFLVGGRQLAKRPTLVSNYAYYPWPSVGRNADVGYINGCADALIRGNYLAGGVAVLLTRCSDVTMTDNRFVGQVDEATASHFRDNQYLAERPREGRVFVRPNRYVRGRGNVAVFNWDRRRSVRVDLSGLGLAAGEPFEIRDVRNYFGTPLVAATYGEPSVDIPLHNMRQPPTDEGASGLPPEFGAAVVLPTRRDPSSGPPWGPRGDADRRWHDAVAMTAPEVPAPNGPGTIIDPHSRPVVIGVRP